MSELLETERSYVKDLEMAVNCFLKPMKQAGSDRDKIPVPLRGKEHIIFGNIKLNWKTGTAKAKEERPDERYISFELN